MCFGNSSLESLSWFILSSLIIPVEIPAATQASGNFEGDAYYIEEKRLF